MDLEILSWTVFPLTGGKILDAANLVNQLETKLYSHTNVDKSSIAFFKNEGFYGLIRRVPIVTNGCITMK